MFVPVYCVISSKICMRIVPKISGMDKSLDDNKYRKIGFRFQSHVPFWCNVTCSSSRCVKKESKICWIVLILKWRIPGTNVRKEYK